MEEGKKQFKQLNLTLYAYLWPSNRSNYPIGLDMLQCCLNSFTSTNKIGVGSVYVVHLQHKFDDLPGSSNNCKTLMNLKIVNEHL